MEDLVKRKAVESYLKKQAYNRQYYQQRTKPQKQAVQQHLTILEELQTENVRLRQALEVTTAELNQVLINGYL